MARGGRDWFFIGADYRFGKSLVRETSEEVMAKGGKVLGAVYAPLGASDFSLFVLQAQQSRADVIALANSFRRYREHTQAGDRIRPRS